MNARQKADSIWCAVYSELSAAYQQAIPCEGGHEDYFAEKRRVVEQQAMADPRVMEANAFVEKEKEAA